MKNWLHRNTSLLLVTGLILLYILSVTINLGYLNLTDEEPKRAEISIEMLKSGEYIVPHTLGSVYYNKPPVFNWILSGIMYLTGSDSEFVLRLPSLVFLLIWGFCHYLVCRKFFSKTSALLSTFFMMTSADLFFYALTDGAQIDIFYSLLVYLQVIGMFWFYQQKKWWPLFLISWLFCAIGFLTKGLPSLLFQCLTMAALCTHARSVRIIFKPQQLAGIALFLLITGSYFYVYSLHNQLSAMWVNLVNESLKKSVVAKESAGKFYRILIYPLLVFKILVPWSILLLVLFKKQRFALFDNPLVRFSFLFIVFNIGIYWFTGVPELRYIYMFIPFVMNIVVHFYEQFEKQNPGRINRWLKYAGIFFCLLLAGVLALPFFFKLEIWPVISIAVLLLLFLLAFFRQNKYRLWLFITGIILVRLIYAVIGIPVQSRGMFEFKNSIATLAEKNNKQPIHFWLPPDTLNLNIVIEGDTLYKWDKKPVVIPPYLYFQIPYYYYHFTGTIVEFDTSLSPGKTYISYRTQLTGKAIDPVYSIYDGKANDSLSLFRVETGKP